MGGNEDIKETIWEYQVSYSELYRELNWPCSYSTLTKRINGDVYMSSPMKQEIKEACELISKEKNDRQSSPGDQPQGDQRLHQEARHQDERSSQSYRP